MNVYLDNNTTTMLDPNAFTVMEPYFMQQYANPNSLHTFATQTHQGIQEAMQKIYESIHADKEDSIVITSSATESNNWVLKSIYFEYILTGKKNHIIVSEAEHPSVIMAARWIESMGCKVSYLPIDSEGIVDIEALKDNITDKTALVSIIWANHKTGAISPIEEIGNICKEHGVLFHTDAVQIIGKLPIDIQSLHIDYLSFSAHTFHGPKGVGALYMRKNKMLTPLLHGDTQMGGYRSGILNVAGIIGMAEAIKRAVLALKLEMIEIGKLRDMFEDELLKIEDSFIITPREKRVPNTTLVSFKGVEKKTLLWDLSHAGIAANMGPYYIPKNLAHSAISFSLSRYTTKEELDYTIDIVKKAVKRIRNISSTYASSYKDNDSDHNKSIDNFEEEYIVCKCAKVTLDTLQEVIRLNDLTTVEEITDYTKAGAFCKSCIKPGGDEKREIYLVDLLHHT